MESSTMIALIFAIVSPFCFGLMGIIDKFVVSRKVKKPLSFAIITGAVNLVIGSVIALFLNWNGIGLSDIIFPAAAGIFIGSQFFTYFYIVSKEDISDVVGLIYTYPVVVALLSFLFLNEVLPLISYVGMLMILSGVLGLSVKSGKIRFKVGIWLIVMLVIFVGLDEFFIKMATNRIPELNGLVITLIAAGLAVMMGLFNKNIRLGVPKELKNIKWALVSESLTFSGFFTLYFAMGGLPATVVSSVAATEPLAVLALESFANRIGIRISAEIDFFRKLVPISLIVLGVVILYLPEMM
jgi:drug/metabolite transporter (DMT)-like permease